MATVDLERLTKRFPDGTLAVNDLSLRVEDREFLVLVGPSGCGKSTTMRMIAGLETSTEGVIRIGGRDVTDVAPKDRDIAMVFQNYALYPHMSVYKNLSFGLSLRYGGGVLARGVRRIFQPHRAKELALLRGGIDHQVRQTAKRLSIENLLDRKPHQLSGGERQRVALGRAIVRNPAAFLFDEPLSNLDAKLRQKMRVELKRLHRELNATMIYVTHDQVEAMTLGDRVAVMNEGEILQVGRPLEIYQRPANLFVARFIGSVPINLQAGIARRRANGVVFTGGPVRFEYEDAGEGKIEQLIGEAPSRDVVIGFRCEDVTESARERVSEAELESKAIVAGTVASVERLGDSAVVYFDDLASVAKSDEMEVGVEPSGSSQSESSQSESSQSELNETKQSEPFVARFAAATEVAPGDRLELSVQPSRVMWFDLHSGENLLKEKT